MSWPPELIYEVLSYGTIDDFAKLVIDADPIFIQASKSKLFYQKLIGNNFPDLGNYDDIANRLQNISNNTSISFQLYRPIISYIATSNDKSLVDKFIDQVLMNRWSIHDDLSRNYAPLTVASFIKGVIAYYQNDIFNPVSKS